MQSTDHQLTLSVWCVNVCEQVCVVTSQILTVVSAEQEAMAWRKWRFQLRPITESLWDSGV